jgi:hypothetical protein
MILFMQPVKRADPVRLAPGSWQWNLLLACGHTKTMPWRVVWFRDLESPGKHQPRFVKCLECEQNGLPTT